jgi:hypothetical protein
MPIPQFFEEARNPRGNSVIRLVVLCPQIHETRRDVSLEVSRAFCYI